MLIDYKNRKLKSTEEISQKEIELKVEHAKLQLESDILATKQSKVEAETELSVAKCTFPLDSNKIIELHLAVEAYTDGLKRLEDLKQEFGF